MQPARSFFHTGDIGDIIAALPVIRAMGGGSLTIGFRNSGQRESLRGERFAALVPLLLAQPYIHSVKWGELTERDNDFSRFRSSQHNGMSLTNWQAQYMAVDASAVPWLTAAAKPHGRAVIARSPRYHNPEFPWARMLPLLVDPLFVGMREEHEAFCREFGWRVEYAPTDNLLETARIIAGCRVFVGNQSAPWWIAAGLGVKCVQESFPLALNSIIHREGMHYPMFNGYDVESALK